MQANHSLQYQATYIMQAKQHFNFMLKMPRIGYYVTISLQQNESSRKKSVDFDWSRFVFVGNNVAVFFKQLENSGNGSLFSVLPIYGTGPFQSLTGAACLCLESLKLTQLSVARCDSDPQQEALSCSLFVCMLKCICMNVSQIRYITTAVIKPFDGSLLYYRFVDDFSGTFSF